MKTCMVYGDMSSEKSSENYPEVTVCDDCYQDMNPGEEDSQIVQDGDYDPSLGDSCLVCGKTEQEEIEEQSN